MARVAVTDGMDENAVKIITDSGHEVVKMHYSSDELLNGALLNFDAVIV